MKKRSGGKLVCQFECDNNGNGGCRIELLQMKHNKNNIIIVAVVVVVVCIC